MILLKEIYQVKVILIVSGQACESQHQIQTVPAFIIKRCIHCCEREEYLSFKSVQNVPSTSTNTCDRVLGKIHIDTTTTGRAPVLSYTTTTGRAPVLSLDEEAKLIGHLKEVSNLGYGYTRQEVVDIASDYAYALGVQPKDKPLTLNWL